MPTYVCSIQGLSLSNEKKSNVAREIARTHNEVTGAPVFFVQVIFNEITSENHFIGGSPQVQPSMYVYGDIRSGRSELDVQRLLKLLVERVASTFGAKPSDTWVYINELRPTHMAEFGHMLPDAGGETAWLQSLPPEEQAYMKKYGVDAGFSL